MSQSCSRGLILLIVAAAIAGTHVASAAPPEIISNSLGMKLVLIPAGEFQMGAEEEPSETRKSFPYCEPKWLDGELPRHKVRITKPFYMGQYEVTLGEFQKFYQEAKYKLDIERDGKPGAKYETSGKPTESSDFRPWAPGWKIADDHPVVFVSWNDSVAFCQWLSKKEGKVYRLPTEAEWEYAARAGTNSRYACGNNPDDLVKYGNAADQDRRDGSDSAVIPLFDQDGKKTDKTTPFPYLSGHDGYQWTAPVGKFQPNAFGLYDTHGNSWEWCSDWFDAHYYENSPVDDPQGPSTGAAHACRGGGFYPTPIFLRCASRGSDPPAFRDCCNGFRVVREQ
jgi:formylglycine-generating enzyme